MEAERLVSSELDDLEADGLRRTLHARPAAGGKFVRDGRTVLNFSSNDYLDLANDARLKAAAKEAVERWGCGAGASRLMSGHLELHEELEAALARLTGRAAALVFGSGFLTNLGVLTTLAGRGDAIFADRLNHASLVDGARLSGARLHRFRHGDADHLDTQLARAGGARRRVVVSDSVFSMDGDRAPLKEIAEAARRHDALLVVDEAHAIGVLGAGGGGLCQELPEALHPDVVIGTLSKALGGYGGFAACSAALRELLINRARSFIYSTATAPAVAAAGLAAARIVSETPELGGRLMTRAEFFGERLREAGCDVPPVASPILPLRVGDNRRALALAEALQARDILAVAVRPPTVPAGTARLRLSVTLAHSENDLTKAARVIGESSGK